MVGSARTGSYGMVASSSASWLPLEEDLLLLPIIPSSLRFSSSLRCSRLGAAASVSASADDVAVVMLKVANDVVVVVAEEEEAAWCVLKASMPEAESRRNARADWSFMFVLFNECNAPACLCAQFVEMKA